MRFKIAVLQPYFFPYIGYWQLINAVDVFVIFDDVNFINRGWINRNNILIKNKPHLITLPLSGASQNDLINEISLHNDIKHKEKILNTIKLAYAKAPFFTQGFGLVEKIILNEELNLAKYLKFQIEEVARYLNIETEIILSSDLHNDKNLKAQDKIIDICKLQKCMQYINPIGGVDLYNKEKFKENEIVLNFIETKNIKYEQFDHDFIANLSIIDIIMFNSPEKIKEMLQEYELV